MRARIVMLLLALCLVAGNALAKDIVFAVDATYPPMEMVDGEKNIVGFGPEVVVAMAKAGGFTAVLKNTAWDGIFAGLAAGKYDAIASSVSINDERKQTMDFSDPYFEVKQGVIVANGSSIKSVADLKGKTIASQIGTTGFFACQKIEGANVKSYDEIGLAVADLFNGRLDAVIADDTVASNYSQRDENFAAKLDTAFLIASDTPEYLGFAVNKGNAEVVDLINKGLAAIRANGEYDKIYAKWFGSN